MMKDLNIIIYYTILYYNIIYYNILIYNIKKNK